MKPLHFRLISLIFLLIGANIEALQSEQNDRNNFVINDDIAGETEEDYEDQLKQEASNETFSVLDTFKEDAPQEEVLEDLLPPVVAQDSNYTFSESEIEPENSTNDDDLPEILLGPKDVTAYLGDRVELRCQVSGKPKPKVQWFSKRDQQLPNIGANFRIHRNNSLIFRRVDKRDESYYQCTAINRHGNISSPMARLTVEAKVNIVEAPDIIRAPFGTSHELQCVATGDPPPLISWLKDGRTVIDAPCK